jgi:hypothetical protein
LSSGVQERATTWRSRCRDRLTTGNHTPKHCLEAAFRFLLDREPKESILSRFACPGEVDLIEPGLAGAGDLGQVEINPESSLSVLG